MAPSFTWLEIRLGCIKTNLQRVREKTGGRKILVPVKANAYGHGLVRVARLLAEEGVDYLGIARWEEGAELRENGIKVPLLLLNGFLPGEEENILSYRITPSLTSEEQIKWLERLGEKSNKKIPLHIYVDTGMGRGGIREERIFRVLEEVISSPSLFVEGIYTHFPSADEDEEFTWDQIRRFKGIKRKVEEKGINIPLWHMANSAGILNFPESYMDMVRPGIMIYGYYPSPKVRKSIKIEPSLIWKASVIGVEKTEAGKGISYGLTYFTSRHCKIVILGVGYGDGYPRALSNKGKVMFKGKKYPVVGRVCMDEMMVEMDEGIEVKIGDSVTILGEGIRVEEMAELLKTIPHEIVSQISRRVRRIYYE